MKELIQIYIGGSGCKLGVEFQKQLREEHNINQDGQQSEQKEFIQGQSLGVYFKKEKDIYQVRGIFIDTDQEDLNYLQLKSPFIQSDYFMCENFLQSSGGNYAKGICDENFSFLDKVKEKVKKEIELCNGFIGFQIISGIQKGTGSGLMVLLVQGLVELYPEKVFQNIVLISQEDSQEVLISPYNQTLALSQLNNFSQSVIVIDNGPQFKGENFEQINIRIAKSLMNVTASFRFESTQNQDLRKMVGNMNPYSQNIFLSISTIEECVDKEQWEKEILEKKNNLLKVNFLKNDKGKQGLFLAGFNIFRQQKWSPSTQDIIQFYYDNKKLFYEGTPDCFHSQNLPQKNNQSTSLLSNNTNISDPLKLILNQFKIMFSKKMYLYGITAYSKMSELDFSEAQQLLEDIIEGYEGFLDNQN